ncbi:hypothetical protein K4K54_011332 [Colletotrichum sp. SAR 10_86]|nr:hypothetical protein K4K51_001180 [Colletotrichum sp. SAR 10_75]KAI8198934.1 hypothetical protein K4K52_009310 [Colletotrichum sp. SAR 10_76]KAI8217660.1 hypothetical protein K4K54_011332 [Colletotrichum sp. SAR 10_86]KAJ4995712.1 hypothetical protein K4K48_009852 [Colletotrichum sp. SAR 10_66]
MATHQNTFSVISNGAPGGAPSRPPMTSKQAQKLYKQANKVPRRSKAEQRKWEKERQEEIKKELERERAAVKAKQARDRKKAKEEEARENRRRQGQPLVDCRPSQDTIARFQPVDTLAPKCGFSGAPGIYAAATSSLSKVQIKTFCAHDVSVQDPASVEAKFRTSTTAASCV